MIQEFFCIFIPGLEWTGLDLSQRGATTECIQPDRNFFTDPTKLVLVINIEIHGIIYQYFTQFNVMLQPHFLSFSIYLSITLNISLSLYIYHTHTLSLSFYLFILIYLHLLISLFLSFHSHILTLAHFSLSMYLGNHLVSFPRAYSMGPFLHFYS